MVRHFFARKEARITTTREKARRAPNQERTRTLVLESLESRLNFASFQGLGNLGGGGEFSTASDISADGKYVVGVSSSPTSFGGEGYRWSEDTGNMVRIGDLAGGSVSNQALAISADGNTVVGTSGSSIGGSEAYRWTAAGSSLQGLGALVSSGHQDGRALGVSSNGDVIVGYDRSSAPGQPTRFEAFRWTPSSTGMMPIPGLSDLGLTATRATSVSDDGSVIVGFGFNGLVTRSFRWASGSAKQLPDLPAGAESSEAKAVSRDGDYVVGVSASERGFEAYRWSLLDADLGTESIEPLGDLPGGALDSVANGVSADGQVIVGRATGASRSEAFIWDSRNHMRSLQDVLINDSGLADDLNGWLLTEATAISPDGNWIVGNGINPQGKSEAWRANILKSGIIWVNRKADDKMELIGATAGVTVDAVRAVIDQAVADWNAVITDFNYASSSSSFGNLFELEVTAKQLSNRSGETVLTGIDNDGKPFRATISLDLRSTAKDGWYIDPDPETSTEFGVEQAQFAFLAGDKSISSKKDLYSVVLHEIGHALGIAGLNCLEGSRCLAIDEFVVKTSRPDTNDKKGDKKDPGTLWELFATPSHQGPVLATLTDRGHDTHIYDGQDCDPRKASSKKCDGKTYDLMSSELLDGQREHISTLDLTILRIVYGFSIRENTGANGAPEAATVDAAIAAELQADWLLGSRKKRAVR